MARRFPKGKQLPAHFVHADNTLATERYEDVYEYHQPGAITGVEHENAHTWTFATANGFRLRVQVLSERIIRVRYSQTATFDPARSYAVCAKFNPTHLDGYQFDENDEAYLIGSHMLRVQIQKADARVTFLNSLSEIVCQESLPMTVTRTILEGTHDVKVSMNAPIGETYYGLGDKSGDLELRGNYYVNYNTDAFAYGKDTDPLYRTIPFYYGLTPNKLGYGIFFDNTYRSHFDFAQADPALTTFSADGGEVDYYFIYGPDLTDVGRQYTDITGTAELPAHWTMGFHQCRWSYYPEQRVHQIAEGFRSRNIPCDAIYLDIDYMDAFRCFTWNKKFFPDPARMIGELKAQGFHTVVMIDPGIKIDEEYFVYQDGAAKDYFCRRAGGERMEGPVWPPECVWPDYTRPEVRTWWGKLYNELYNIQGVSGFWNDMNEPAVFKVNTKTFPDNVMHDFEGRGATHARVHNVYGMQMVRATRDGLAELQQYKRPFVITRAAYSGTQRYSACWTGDNVASWDHLRIANRQCQRMSISGYSFIGTDIGGFVDPPTGELMVRWLQLGAFHPLYRVHSMGNNVDGASEVDVDALNAINSSDARLDQEPWVYGDTYTDQARAAIEFRYRLLPYLYTAFQQYSATGTPVLRSLVFADQQDETAAGRENEFMVGNDLIAAPVVKAGQKTKQIYLPKGNWYDFHRSKAHVGGGIFRYKVDADKAPLFARAGSTIPLYNVRQHTGEAVETLTLRLFYSKSDHTSHLYEDAGEGYAYKANQYRAASYAWSGSEGALQISTSGDFEPTYKNTLLELAGFPKGTNRVTADGQALRVEKVDGRLVVALPVGVHRVVVG